MAKWEGGYCDRCNNTGEVDCHCGGDLCVCGRDTLPCPKCHGEYGDDDGEECDELETNGTRSEQRDG